MGACNFDVIAKGKTAAEAFNTVTSQARWEHGHGGYSGTIAEKREFVMLTVPEGVEPRRFVEWVIGGQDRVEREVSKQERWHRSTGSGDKARYFVVEWQEVPAKYRAVVDAATRRVDDKWGPAGCIRVGPEEFLFFGWASS